MERILGVLAWPGVVLVLGLVALLLFRGPIAALIGRTRKVGKTGLETFAEQPTQPAGEEKAGVDAYLRTFDSPLLVEAENLILKDFKDRKIDAAPDRERALVRALASTRLVLRFEITHKIIWASQVTTLHLLNSRTDGMQEDEVLPFYEAAREAYASWYVDYPFDRWLGFLQQFGLILRKDSRCLISVAGREFLKYLVATGKSGPFEG